MNRRAAAALGVLALVLGGCGLKGALYLPEKPGDVVVRPATTPATTPAAPAGTPPAAPPGSEAPPPPSGQVPSTGPGRG